MAALVFTDAAGVTRTLQSDAPALVAGLPAAEFTPAPGPLEGPLGWPLSGGDAVGFVFRDRDQYASFTIIELAADADTQALGALAAGHLMDGKTARFLTHDRAGRQYVVDVGRQGSAVFGRMGVSETRFQLAVMARRREATNLLTALAGLSLTMADDANANGIADGWTHATSGTITSTPTINDGAQRLVISGASSGAYAEVASPQLASGTVQPGDVLTAAVTYRTDSLADLAAQIHLLWWTSGGVFVSSASAVLTPQAGYTRGSVTGTAPATAARVSMLVRAFATGPGAGAGTVWAKDAQLERASAPTAWSASAVPGPFVVTY